LEPGDRVIERIRKQLDTALPGESVRLDWHFFRLYGEPFIKVLINNPEKAYEALLDYYGGESPGVLESVRYIIYTVLNILFLRNRSLVNKAHEAFFNKDWDRFREIIRNYITKYG